MADPLQAQIPQPPDTLADSLRPPPVDETKRYLEAQEQEQVIVNTMPLLGNEGPLPPMGRIVLDRDSIQWADKETVSDLLQRTPGVYLWRGGWLGRPEYANFQARGATAVQYYLDGMPYLAVGADSVGVDPSLLPLSFLARVEIERWPGLLRVYLFSQRHDRLSPASLIGVARGDRGVARFTGDFEKRYRFGLGFVLAAEYLNAPTTGGVSSASHNTQYWIQTSFIRPHYGLQFQLIGLSVDRDPYVSQTGLIGDSLRGTRNDAQFRAFWRKRPDGLGPSVDLVFERTGWTGQGIEQQINQVGAVLGYRSPTLGVNASVFNRSRWVPWDLHAEAGWAPLPAVTVDAEGGYQLVDGDRNSQWLGLRAGVQLPLRVALSGSWRVGSIVAAPAIASNPAQDINDVQLNIGWQRSFAGIEVGYARTAAFRPLTFQPYLNVDSLRPAGQADWLTASLRISPRPWLTVQGWYSNPTGPIPDGLPPKHFLGSISLRSKFWRTFPSGAFELKLEGSMEKWTKGVIGRNAAGGPISLAGATFFRTLIQVQLESFTLFWDRTNLSGTLATYVPGFTIPAYVNLYGAKWAFKN